MEAAHIPVEVGLVLPSNRRELPKELQPSTFVFVATALAGAFFALFEGFYVVQLVSS